MRKLIEKADLGDESRSINIGNKFPQCRLATIGRGSSSIVHKSIHLNKLIVVAEKVVVVSDINKQQQLVSELRSLRAILDGENSSPYIVKLYDVLSNPVDGTISICLEYMDGGSLQDIVVGGGCQNESVLAG